MGRMADTMQSKRDQMAALMSEMRDDQNNAIKEYAAYMKGVDGQQFKEKLQGFINRTMPGSQFDQVFGAMLSVFNSSVEMADNFVVPASNTDQGTTSTTDASTTTETPPAA